MAPIKNDILTNDTLPYIYHYPKLIKAVEDDFHNSNIFQKNYLVGVFVFFFYFFL